MKKYDQIHESIVKDVLDMFDAAKSLTDGELEDIIKRHKNKSGRPVIKSITSASDNLIAVFPVLSSRNIDIANQAICVKAIEKNCVSMLQMLFAAYQINDSTNVADFLSAFHTNISKSSKAINIDDLIDLGDRLQIEATEIHEGDTIPRSVLEAAKNDMKNMYIVLDESVNPVPISRKFSCKLNAGGDYIVEAQAFKMNEGASEPYIRDQETYSNIDKNISTINKNISGVMKDATDVLSKQILNGEYKKANEYMPTMIVVNFKAKTDSGYETIDNALIGVKAKLYPMSSTDIITHMVGKVKDSNWIQKAIKASTREISFFKDFLFAIDKAKVDALSMSRKGSSNKLWKVLERRATKSKFNRLMARSNDATAITTLMISQNEVDYIKKEYQIDIAEVSTARRLMEGFNLMGMVIVDESLEIAKFLQDSGDDLWETISFTNLERESNDNTYKKVVNLMTKVM